MSQDKVVSWILKSRMVGWVLLLVVPFFSLQPSGIWYLYLVHDIVYLVFVLVHLDQDGCTGVLVPFSSFATKPALNVFPTQPRSSSQLLWTRIWKIYQNWRMGNYKKPLFKGTKLAENSFHTGT